MVDKVRQVTRAIAGRHEALFVRMAALKGQVDAVAARRSGALVSDMVRAAAEDVLFDARPFGPKVSRRLLPVAAPDYGGLAVQLAMAMAQLQHFETSHTEWSAEQRCRAWCVEGVPLQVARLRPESVLQLPKSAEDGEREDIRSQLMERIKRLYDSGFSDGLSAQFEAVDDDPADGDLIDGGGYGFPVPEPRIR
jgi:hypothetical protein